MTLVQSIPCQTIILNKVQISAGVEFKRVESLRVRLLARSLRYFKRATIIVGLVECLLLSPGQSQPLHSGVQLETGVRFVTDGDSLRAVSKDRDLSDIATSTGVTQILQGSPEVWTTSFLVQTDGGLFRATQDTDGVRLDPLLEDTEIKPEAWGDAFLVPSKDRQAIVWISSGSVETLPVDGGVKTLTVVDSNLVVISTALGFSTLRVNNVSGSAPTLGKVKLPFSQEKAELSTGSGRAILWNPDSRKALDLNTGETLTFNQKPSVGVKVMNQGDILAVGAQGMDFLGAEGGRRQFIRPTMLDAASLKDWNLFRGQKSLQALWQAEDSPSALSFNFVGPVSSQTLATGRIHTLIQPGPDAVNTSPLLFVETSLEEPKLDEEGEPIIDLETRKPASLKVLGHQIWSLGSRNQWQTIVDEPRASLVGPVQRVGSRVLYATQTEPEHTLGESISVNHRYPYPAVILQSRTLETPTTDAWTYEQPRGETPSKGRLPQSAWPTLTEKGPLVLTTEGNALVAIDLESGKAVWTSAALPLDDSSPEMLSWGGELFALIATKDSTRALLLMDPTTGEVQKQLALNATFFREKTPHLIALILVCAALAYYIYAAGRRTLYIRKIAGLNALDEAVGRATEMGKPVLYVVGLADVDDIQTLASLSILSHVARRTAEYDTPIALPPRGPSPSPPPKRSCAMPTASPVVRRLSTWSRFATFQMTSSATPPASTASWSARNRPRIFT